MQVAKVVRRDAKKTRGKDLAFMESDPEAALLGKKGWERRKFTMDDPRLGHTRVKLRSVSLRPLPQIRVDLLQIPI
jgi:hypothetical protein